MGRARRAFAGRGFGGGGGVGGGFSLKPCVLFKALCAAVSLVSCVAMNNHRYAICTMDVSHIREVQQTLTSVGKHCFMAPMTILFLYVAFRF